MITHLPISSRQHGTLTPTIAEEDIVITPTPRPTATPGLIDQSVAEISAETGLDKQVFLGLTGPECLDGMG